MATRKPAKKAAKKTTKRTVKKTAAKAASGETIKAPLTERQVIKEIRPRKALKKFDGKFEHRIAVSRSASDSRAVVSSDKTGLFLNIEMDASQLGVHAFPKGPELSPMTKPSRKKGERAPFLQYTGFLPDHLPLQPSPGKLERNMVAKPRIHGTLKMKRGNNEPTTIFAPDQRYLFQDTAYPWCTTGRVDTPAGQASGTMVGPRHLLTCSHAIQWNSDGSAGWVKFTPSYFDGSAPFGEAWGTRVYFYNKADGSDGMSRHEEQYDYVVVVLDRRMGDTTGWMGGRSWSDDWDDEAYWRHIGYPGDLASGQRPSYQRDIAMDGSFWDSESHTRIFHEGDVWPGQSGGSFFAWWSGENYPSVVAVQSAHNSDENIASGGSDMINIIIKARNEHP